MSEYILPDFTGFLRYHTRWKRRSLGPYEEEFMELLSENGIRYRKISKLLKGSTSTVPSESIGMASGKPPETT